MPQFFDAHLDLAYLAEVGRDMHAPLDDCRGRLLPASITLPSLRDGGVRACLGTIFTEAIAPDGTTDTPEASYPEGDALGRVEGRHAPSSSSIRRGQRRG